MQRPSIFSTVETAISSANVRARGRFRIVHFALRADHLDLLVEALSAAALSQGVRGLAVSVARLINATVGRRGRLWGDRWQSRELSSPGAVRAALVALFGGFRRHHRGARPLFDVYSSAPYFTGFSEFAGRMPAEATTPGAFAHVGPADLPVREPRTSLLKFGWRRLGRLSVYEKPPAGATD